LVLKIYWTDEITKFTTFIAPHNFDVDTADKGTQMRLRELQWYAVLNKN